MNKDGTIETYCYICKMEAATPLDLATHFDLKHNDCVFVKDKEHLYWYIRRKTVFEKLYKALKGDE